MICYIFIKHLCFISRNFVMKYRSRECVESIKTLILFREKEKQ